jgi:hypothetical protein
MSSASTSVQFLRSKSGKRTNVRIGGKAKPKHAGKRDVPLATIRCREIDRYIIDRYGPVMPDDDAARDDVMIMLHHIAYKQAADRQWLMNDWLDQRAPWLIADERAAFIRKVFLHPIRYSADTLAEKLGLTWARRHRLGITTFWAIDMPREVHNEMGKAEKRERQRKVRRAAGCQPREVYEADSVKNRAKAEGISLRTWYRRQKAKTHYAAHGPVPHIVRVQITVTSQW